MALKRATKSIPLSGGSNNEAPDELLSPPGMLHIENARFSKKEYAEKTEPMTSQGATGLSFHTGQDPYALNEVNGDLISIGKDNFARWDGSSFDTTAHNTDPVGIQKILSTAEQAGGNNFTWCAMGVYSGGGLVFTTTGYAVAFEKRNNAGEDSFRHLYLQRYDVAGNLFDETKIVGGYGPRLHATNSIVGAILFYQVATTTLKQAVVGYLTQDAITSTTTVATAVEDRRQEYVQGITWAAHNVEEMRQSFAYNTYENATYAVKFNVRDGNGAVVWKDHSAGTIKYQMLSAAGVVTGSVFTLSGPSADVSDTSVNTVLDVDVDDTHVYVLAGLVDTTDTSGDTTINVYSVTHANGSAATSAIRASGGYTVPHGTLAVDSSGNAHVAFTHYFGDVGTRFPIGSTTLVPSLLFYHNTSKSGAGVLDFQLYHHRAASNLVLDKDGNPSLVVEQYSNFTPNVNATGGVDAPAITPAAIKPVTSVLVRVDESANTIHVLATIDAGQSKVQDYSISEQSNHLATLTYMDTVSDTGVSKYHTYRYMNRNIMTAEDSFVFLSTDTASADTVAHGNTSLLAGSARGNLYEVGPGVRLSTVKYGEGFLVNTAVPMWFDGGGLGEASIIDQPEITSVSTDQSIGTGAITWAAYNAVKAGYQTVTCVCGYTDLSGKVHRSAPSFPVFVGNIHELDGNTVQSLHATATTPLSVSGTNREYFMEFYLADEGDSVGDLATTKHFLPNESGTVIQGSFMTNLAPTTNLTHQATTSHQSPALYTAGDVLPADPWPSFKHMAVTSRRMFALAEIAPSTIYYSKIFEENVAPEFSAALVLSIGGATKLTGIGRIDDKIIAFEKDAVHLIYGPGPDNTGANGDFTVERMSTNFGCEDIDSILSTNDGLAYYSSVSKEFHLITRDIQIIDIGKPVQDITANTSFDVKTGLVYPAEHELRWYVSNAGTTDLVATATLATGTKEQPPRARVGRSVQGNGTVLVFNTQYAKWTSNSGPGIGYGTALYNNQPALIDASSVLWTTSTDWTDGELMTWETPWIKVNMLQDFGRIFKATFLGRYLSSWDDTSGSVEAGDLNITCSYDYEEDGDTDTHRFRANEHFGASGGERLQFSLRPDRPKCQAIKFRIEETATTAIEVSEPTYATGRGISLLSVDIHYGIKGGSSRLSATRKL